MNAKDLPAWLSAAVDQRLALMMDTTGGVETFRAYFEGKGMVLTPLTEPEEGATEEEHARWDRSCDNCGHYCKPGEDFYTGHVHAVQEPITIMISFGVCPACKELGDG